jgi:RimJ/RimL family protein N-acetyltransferase
MDAAPKVRPAALARPTSDERGPAGRYDPGMSEGDGYRLRPATVADAAVLAAQRRAMFEAMWSLEAEAAGALEAATLRYLSRAVPAGEYRAWLIEQRGTPVCGGGVQLRPLVPRPGHLDGRPEALILSVWTEPAHRRRGLATRVVGAILDGCRELGITRITLHASDEGRRIYERLGFRQTNEMRLDAAGSGPGAPGARSGSPGARPPDGGAAR